MRDTINTVSQLVRGLACHARGHVSYIRKNEMKKVNPYFDGMKITFNPDNSTTGKTRSEIEEEEIKEKLAVLEAQYDISFNQSCRLSAVIHEIKRELHPPYVAELKQVMVELNKLLIKNELKICVEESYDDGDRVETFYISDHSNYGSSEIKYIECKREKTYI